MTVDLIALLVFATPIGYAALGETIGQRAGVLNIGLEGMMLIGAYAALAATASTGSPWLGLGAGFAFGMLAALLSAWFSVWLNADQVVVGTAVNFIALGITGTLFRLDFGQSGALVSVPKLPTAYGIDAALVALAIATASAAWLLSRTNLGLALRACGEFPLSVAASGSSVKRLRLFASLVCGAFAGIGGAYLCVGITGSFAENMTAGRGYVAIAMVAFGRWKPVWVIASALLIGFAESLQFTFQAIGSQLPYQLFIAMPYALALLVLVLTSRKTAAPAALGVPLEERLN